MPNGWPDVSSKMGFGVFLHSDPEDPAKWVLVAARVTLRGAEGFAQSRVGRIFGWFKRSYQTREEATAKPRVRIVGPTYYAAERFKVR